MILELGSKMTALCLRDVNQAAVRLGGKREAFVMSRANVLGTR